MTTDTIDVEQTIDESTPGDQSDLSGDQVAHSIATGSETSMGLSENVAGALSYLLGILTGIVFLVMEKDNQYVRFNAAQSIVVFGGIAVLAIGLSVLGTGIGFILGDFIGLFVGFILFLVWAGLGLVSFVLWVFLMFRAYQGKSFRVPIAAGYADRIAK
jgi:uncharacterized membrane protein